MPHHRLIILGAGTAGLSAYKQASELSEDILLIDPGPLGTTCARVGCMPSKALLQVAREVHATHSLHRRQLLKGPLPALDPKAVMEQVRALRDHFVSGPVRAVEKMGKHYLQASARFLGPDRIEARSTAGVELFSADAIIVATGSRPLLPPAWQAFGSRVLTSDSLFELSTLPMRLAVVGLGALGCELGQALAMLGVEVHAFGRGSARVAGMDQPELAALAHKALAEHFTIHQGHEARLRAADPGLLVEFGEQRIEVDAVLAALGRTPAVEGLNLAALGLPLDALGLPAIDAQSLRAGDTAVFFAGDVNALTPLMHEAADDGRLAAWYALHPQAPCLARRTPLAITFTEPQTARCGLGQAELPAGALTGRSNFGTQGRSVIMGQSHGLMLVHADAGGRLIGAEMVCAGAEHLAHELAWLIQRGVDVIAALQLPFYHPVLEEGLRSALQDIRRQLPARERRPDLPLCGQSDEGLPGI